LNHRQILLFEDIFESWENKMSTLNFADGVLPVSPKGIDVKLNEDNTRSDIRLSTPS